MRSALRRGRKNGADPADPEEPANRRCTQMRWIKLADIDAGRTVDARIDPANQSDGDIEPDAGGVCEPQVKERADEVIEEQHRTPTETIDQDRAGGARNEDDQ